MTPDPAPVAPDAPPPLPIRDVRRLGVERTGTRAAGTDLLTVGAESSTAGICWRCRAE